MATDYYKLCEDGLKTVLAQLTAYFQNDWQIMNGDETGLIQGAEYFLRLHPDNFSDTVVESQQAEVDWTIEAKMYVRFQELQTSWDAFRALRSEIFFKVLQYPSLNGVTGVTSVRIGASESPVYIVDDPEVANPTPLFISQTFQITVHQILPLSGGEYA